MAIDLGDRLKAMASRATEGLGLDHPALVDPPDPSAIPVIPAGRPRRRRLLLAAAVVAVVALVGGIALATRDDGGAVVTTDPADGDPTSVVPTSVDPSVPSTVPRTTVPVPTTVFDPSPRGRARAAFADMTSTAWTADVTSFDVKGRITADGFGRYLYNRAPLEERYNPILDVTDGADHYTQQAGGAWEKVESDGDPVPDVLRTLIDAVDELPCWAESTAIPGLVVGADPELPDTCDTITSGYAAGGAPFPGRRGLVVKSSGGHISEVTYVSYLEPDVGSTVITFVRPATPPTIVVPEVGGTTDVSPGSGARQGQKMPFVGYDAVEGRPYIVIVVAESCGLCSFVTDDLVGTVTGVGGVLPGTLPDTIDVVLLITDRGGNPIDNDSQFAEVATVERDNFSVVIDSSTAGEDGESSIASRLDTGMLPTGYLVDGTGTIRFIQEQPDPVTLSYILDIARHAEIIED